MMPKEFYVFHNTSFIDLFPIQFGQEDCTPAHSFGPGLTHNYLFHYVLSGKGTFFQTERQIHTKLVAGQGFLIPPDTICSYEADVEEPWHYCWIEFNGSKAKHLMREAGFSKQNLIYSSKSKDVEHNIKFPLLSIIQNHRQHDAFIIGQFYLFIDSLIRYSIHHNQPKESHVQNFYIREAIAYIGQNFQTALTVEDIAQHCNLNRNYFSRLFKEELNMSPSELINQYRMNLACELLTTTKQSVKEIAELVGYSNQFNFSAAFKKKQHISPLEWRKLYS
ncbi:AraC family transcriptional regulator [Aerococcaceae bacterium NML160702]|nr:AraC family transcriptional regulator [Aerococcaceae bacterium NML171108]MCW6680792.1 AraC family transcriptional regulator [Aerococcaceae bacterium NML130460]MCW6682188.1 AraC family transcriptional regulator [Aerococcaceae bacterium NML160702]